MLYSVNERVCKIETHITTDFFKGTHANYSEQFPAASICAKSSWCSEINIKQQETGSVLNAKHNCLPTVQILGVVVQTFNRKLKLAIKNMLARNCSMYLHLKPMNITCSGITFSHKQTWLKLS